MSPEGIDALCLALQASRAALVDREAAELARTLGGVGERFLDPEDPIRAEALELLPSASGLSRPTCEAVLDGMAADWTAARLGALVEAELGDASALDRFVDRGPRREMAVGPALCVQILAGSVPGVSVSALLRSLLVKGPTLLKPSRGDAVLPVLFARALREADPALADALAVVYWPGGSDPLDDAALRHADVAVVYGSDATVRALRARVSVAARFVAYHHRVSIGVVGRGALNATDLARHAAEVAHAIALFDQRGCVSPQLVFVEEGGACSPADLADALAEALGELEERLPSGPLEPAESSALHQARGTAELVAASCGGRVLHGGASPWTVIFEPDSARSDATLRELPSPPVGRCARVRPVAAADSLEELLRPFGSHLQTVGVAGLGDRKEALARAMGRLGASRVVPFTEVAFPPPWWHHDGGGPLRDLVRWVDLGPG